MIPSIIERLERATNARPSLPVKTEVGDFGELRAALDRAGIATIATDQPAPATFMGMPVVVNRTLPPNGWVVKRGGEVVAWGVFRALDTRAMEGSDGE